jgi:hypothetical protein
MSTSRGTARPSFAMVRGGGTWQAERGKSTAAKLYPYRFHCASSEQG